MDARAEDLRTDLPVLAERYALGPHQLEALSVFVERVREGEQGGGVKEKWRNSAVEKLAESLEALELEQVRAANDAADIGSGAGFPGLALAAARPEMRMALIETKEKRCAFLRETVDAMGLTNVEVVQRQVQLWSEGQERFDLVTSRGVRRLPFMVALGAPLLRVGGTLVLWTSGGHDDAVAEAASAAARASGLVSTAVVSRAGLDLHTYSKESPGGDALSVDFLQRWDRPFRPPRRKAGHSLSKCEERIAKISRLIDRLEEARSRASETQRTQLDSDLQRLLARRTLLVEQLEQGRREGTTS